MYKHKTYRHMKSLDLVKYTHCHQKDCMKWNTKVGREVGEEANLLSKPPSWSLWSILAVQALLNGRG